MRLVTRTEIGLDPVVRNSNGTKRLELIRVRYVTGHWPGTNVRYASTDVSAFIRELDEVMWRMGKPNEYNHVIGQQDDGLVHEYAGGFVGAHSAGENPDSDGVLFLNGISEPITDAQIVKYQWLRDRVLVPYGIVRPGPDERPHGAMPGANTQCPGPTIIGAYPRLRLPYIDPVSPVEEDDMSAHPFVALYVPSSTVNAVRPNAKWFVLLRDGSIRHCTGPDTVEADANAVPHRTIEGAEHYDQLDRLSQVNEPA
jgi:hypothetical protein